MANALTLSTRMSLPIVACNDVHTHEPMRQPLQDLVSAIRLKTTVAELGYQGFPNAERTLRTINDLQSLYPSEMLAESMRIAERCHFSMDERATNILKTCAPAPDNHRISRQLTMAGPGSAGLKEFPATRGADRKELELIATLKYEHYFHRTDIVQFARSQKILCQGRGSGNSAVCYCSCHRSRPGAHASAV